MIGSEIACLALVVPGTLAVYEEADRVASVKVVRQTLANEGWNGVCWSCVMMKRSVSSTRLNREMTESTS